MQGAQAVHVRICAVDARIALHRIRQVECLVSDVGHLGHNVTGKLMLNGKIPRLHAPQLEIGRESGLYEYRQDEADIAWWHVIW